MGEYDVMLALLGAVGIMAAVLPRLLRDRPLSHPILFVVGGLLLGWLPLDTTFLPTEHTEITERLTELGVIVALMGSGLKMGRPLGRRTWGTTWRLLAVTMPLTIAATVFVGAWAGLPVAAALLAGAVLAPTDPVLASDVQLARPGRQDIPKAELETRFALTSEAGLNDGLAFPFTYLAIAFLATGSAGAWIIDWVLMDVVYRIAVGLLVGVIMGRLLATVIFHIPNGLAKTSQGFVVVSMTLVTYGAAELLHGYGFIAVFVAAVAFRQWERSHDYHQILHGESEMVERTIMALLLVLFGAAITAGLLQPLTWPLALGALLVLFVVRPLAGWIGLYGSPLQWPERSAIAVFGIRGIGSFYYISFALNQAEFPAADALWAFIAFIVLASIILHGVTARPAMKWVESHGKAA